MTVRLVIPFPPSANRLWRAVQGRNIASKRYREWKGEALARIYLQRPGKIAGPYRMSIVATRPDKRRRDLSNITKALEDALVDAGVVRDDSDAQAIHLEWSADQPSRSAGVVVTLEAA